jgi:hypothetical protein
MEMQQRRKPQVVPLLCEEATQQQTSKLAKETHNTTMGITRAGCIALVG